MDGFECVLPFDRDNSEFARGVEVGLIWARLDADEHPLTVLAHTDNAEMLLRISDAHGTRATATEIGDDWFEVNFS